MNIILIGNADNFIAGNGKIIDSFNRNVRFNCFVIDGYEDKVGKKIDIICTNNVAFSVLDINTFKHYKSCNEIWIPIITKESDNYNILKNKIKVLNNDDFKKIVNEEINTKRYFSTGFWGIRMAMAFGYDNIYITGFDFGKTGHYFSKGNERIICSGEYEKKEILKLISENKIKRAEKLIFNKI